MKNFGWKGPDFKDPRDYKYTAHPDRYRGVLPREVDLPETPVEDQGNVGCCVFKALTSLAENAEFDWYFSALWLYWQYRLKFGDVNQDDGAYIRIAIKLAADIGFVNEVAWPYDEVKWDRMPPEIKAVRRIGSYWNLETIDDIMVRLAQPGGNGCIFGMPVYENFYRVGPDGIVPPVNPKADRFLGGHSMKVVGYLRGGELLKIKNSWGTPWGAKGYCYFTPEMARDYWDDCWTIDSLT